MKMDVIARDTKFMPHDGRSPRIIPAGTEVEVLELVGSLRAVAISDDKGGRWVGSVENSDVGIDAEPDECAPCYRTWDGDPENPGWWCRNDHTGCSWNDGNNTCMHPGESNSPLEDE
jgi:hypothetical protein